jgi:transposase
VSESYSGRQVVGIDLHRRRTVIVREAESGERLGMARFDSTPVACAGRSAAGTAPRVVIEATYGWYWAVECLQAMGCEVHMAHPLGVKGFAYRRVKNDERDAADLADLLRMGRLPESWIAPPATRALRELVRHRNKLVRWRSSIKASIHAVLAKRGITVPVSDLFGKTGTALLDQVELEPAYAARLASQRRLLAVVSEEVSRVDALIAAGLAGHAGYQAVQQISGVGPVVAAIFVAEIGDVHRFPSADKLASWAGLTPKHRESDATVHRGRITKQGSRLLRWAAVEAVQRSQEPLLTAKLHSITERRGQLRRPGERSGRNLAKVAAARVLIKLVYYGLRDGHIRALDQARAA